MEQRNKEGEEEGKFTSGNKTKNIEFLTLNVLYITYRINM